jgi:hypothetical protein
MKTLTKVAAWCAGVTTVALIATSCYPSHGLSVEDYDTVLTGYVSTTDFPSYRTYWMPDSILVDNDSRAELADEVKKFKETILSTVAANLATLGYRRLTNADTLTEKPDVQVFCGMTSGTFEAYYSYWYPYWGWYYPYYPPYYGTTTVTVGGVLIDMVDNDVTIAGKRGGIVWAATLSGIAEGGVTQSYLQGKINQAFIQSPYLQTGGAQ